MSIDACAQRLSMCLPATRALPRAALIDGPPARTASAFAVKSRTLQQRILESGLVTKADLRASLSATRLRRSEGTPIELTRELVRRKLLTRYQARVLYHEKCDPLVLGQYVILDEVGRGGVGRVFKAEHRGLKRTVALKIPSFESEKRPASIERFRREVTVAGRLDHPNIISTYDAGEINGRPL